MQQETGIFRGIVTAVVVACLAVGGGYWWWTHRVPAPGTPAKNRAQAPRTVLSNGNGDGSNDGPTNDGDSPTHRSPTSPSAAALDLSRTSWQDPFSAAYWNAHGWTFDGRSMRSERAHPAEATFRRPYRRLRLDVNVRRLAPSAESRPSHGGRSGTGGSFAIRLFTAETETTTTVTLHADDIVVTADTPTLNNALIKQRKLDSGLGSGRTGRLGLAATGNRLIIVWNRRPVLTCSQPAEQSGRAVTVTLTTDGAGFLISHLRIEGE